MIEPAASRYRLHGTVLSDGRELHRCRVEVAGGRIVSVVPDSPATGVDLVVEAGWIAPGLIDLQVNGAGGVDLTAGSDPALEVAAVARVLTRHGVTAFCPTVISAPPEAYAARLAAYAPRAHGSPSPEAPHRATPHPHDPPTHGPPQEPNADRQPLEARSQAALGEAEGSVGARSAPGSARVARGATSLGPHLEGPWLNPARRGAHAEADLRLPSVAEIDGWLTAGPPAIVTLAPELAGGIEAVRRLAAAGVLVSLGHTAADAATVRRALAAGARMGTHLFNAMPSLHHREPGPVGALLADGSAAVGLIADGVHLDPLIVELVVRLKGPERVVLVSDAAAPAGAPPGRYTLGGEAVESDGRTVRRADGTLAGSAALLDACLRNLRAWLPWLPSAEIIRMATETPARLLTPGPGARKGRLAPGYDADIILLDPDWHVTAVMLAGHWTIPPSPGR